MRVIAGKHRGRRLADLPIGDLAVRPTPDKVRESIFAIIGDRVRGARFLDLFSGTGAMGIEALSRGASHALFVDASPDSVRIIRRNIETLGLSDRYRTVLGESISTLKKGNAQSGRFDFVYIDPPYSSGLALESVPLLAEHKWVDENSQVFVESGSAISPDAFPGIQQERSKRYGQVWISIWRPAPR